MTALLSKTDSASLVIQKCTSSWLIKTIADNNKGYLLSREIYDILYIKLLKSD